MVSECGSPLPLSLGTGCGRTSRLVPHEVRESRAREDSRTPGRCRAHPRSRPGNEADPRDGWKAPKLMDAEWSRSAAVLCRSRWERDAEERVGWSRTRFASRERERTRALQDAAALIPVAAKGTRRIPGTGGKPPADGLRTVPECGSPLPLLLGTGCGRTSRLVPHEVRESRAREDSRTPPSSRRGNEADPRRMESPQLMDAEWSRSAAVLCRSAWERDAKRRGVWSPTRFASRERERTRALRDAVALTPVAAEGTRRIPDGWKAPKLMDSERSRSATVLCRSRWERDAKGHDVWSRNEFRESRAREASRTPRRCRAQPQSVGKLLKR